MRSERVPPLRTTAQAMRYPSRAAAQTKHPLPAHPSTTRGEPPMARRPCLACGTPTTGTRCPTCGTSPGRDPQRRAANYGTAHQAERTRLATTLPTHCWYGCGTLLHPGDRWVAAHVHDGDPQSPRVVSCRSCNERAKDR